MPPRPRFWLISCRMIFHTLILILPAWVVYFPRMVFIGRSIFAWVFETKLKTHLSQIRLFHICRKECLVDRPELSSKLLKIIIPDNPIYNSSETHQRILYSDSISPTHNADLNNTGGREAGSATAAGFLSAFVPEDIPWAHFDIAGVMDTKGTDGPYLSKGMTGRPTRTLFKIVENYYSK